MAEGTNNTSGGFVSATWTAEQTTNTSARVTNNLTLSKGTWLIILSFPNLTSGAGLVSLTGSNVAYAYVPNYFPIGDLVRYCVIGYANADTNIYLESASSAEVNYSNITRGSLTAVKIG